MIPQSPLEKVARAISSEDGCGAPLGYFPNGSPMRDSVWDEFMSEQHAAWRAMARAALTALQNPDEGTVEAMELALSEWRKSLTPDEAILRRSAPMENGRQWLASATPAEKHKIRFNAAIQHILKGVAP